MWSCYEVVVLFCGLAMRLLSCFVVAFYLTSQKHADVSLGRICTDNSVKFCRTDSQLADHICCLTPSQHSDTGPTSPVHTLSLYACLSVCLSLSVSVSLSPTFSLSFIVSLLVFSGSTEVTQIDINASNFCSSAWYLLGLQRLATA